MFEKVKNILIYAGVSREDYLEVREDIRESNRKSLLVIAIMVAVAMFGMLLSTLFDPTVQQNVIFYIVTLVYSGVIAVLAGTVATKSNALVMPLAYMLIAEILAFGIVLGTIGNPDEATVSYIVLLFAVPLFFTDRPISMIIMLLVSIVAYFAAAFATQSSEMVAYNAGNVIAYGLFSMAMCVYMMRVKVKRYILEREKKFLSECDQLTGLFNRRSYEQHLSAIREDGNLSYTTICAFDVNGLKIVNDNLGHKAGDELLIGAANCLHAVFGQYGICYRIGGDEYMAILDGVCPTDEELIGMLGRITTGWKGSLVTGLSISVGIQHYEEGMTLDDMTAGADQKMYADKANYYSRNGIDRRRS